jgi:hypothetical protein
VHFPPLSFGIIDEGKEGLPVENYKNVRRENGLGREGIKRYKRSGIREGGVTLQLTLTPSHRPPIAPISHPSSINLSLLPFVSCVFRIGQGIKRFGFKKKVFSRSPRPRKGEATSTLLLR